MLSPSQDMAINSQRKYYISNISDYLSSSSYFFGRGGSFSSQFRNVCLLYKIPLYVNADSIITGIRLSASSLTGPQ